MCNGWYSSNYEKNSSKRIDKIQVHHLLKFYLISNNNRDAGITPVFVFNGFSIRIWERPGYGNADKTKKRRNAWISYEQGKPEEAAHIFLSTSNSSVSIEFLRSIIKYFKQNNVEFFIAPYLSFAQVLYIIKYLPCSWLGSLIAINL